MAQGGWIKLWRKAEENPYLQEFDALGVWAALLMRAARQPKKVPYRGRHIPVERGQLVISVREFAREGRLSYKRLRTILNAFKQGRMIGAEGGAGPVAGKGAEFTLITICNYDEYQSLDDGEGAGQGAARAQQGRRVGRTEQEEKKGRREELDTEEACVSSSPPRAHTREAAPDDDEVAPSLVGRLAEAAGTKPAAVTAMARTWTKATGSAGIVETMIADVLRRKPDNPLGYLAKAVRDHHAQTRAPPQAQAEDRMTRLQRWMETPDDDEETHRRTVN